MIITNPDSNHIHITLDEVDLKNKDIPLIKLISNPKYTKTSIYKLLDCHNKLSISDLNIFTYNFKIFHIEVSIS